MTSDQLIGKVAACYLRDRLTEDDSTGVARYLLDCLTAEQTAAIAKAILEDSSLAQLVEIKLPVHFVGNHGLPPTVLTEERTTYFRNAACEKSALLVANTGDDEEQSLKELVPIGALQLQEQPELWVSQGRMLLLLAKRLKIISPTQNKYKIMIIQSLAT